MVREQVGRSQWKQSGRRPTACVRAKLEFPPRELVTKKAPSAHRVRSRENAIYKSSPKFSQSGSFLRFVPPIPYRRGRHMSRSYSVFFLLLTFFSFSPFRLQDTSTGPQYHGSEKPPGVLLDRGAKAVRTRS